MVKGNRKIGLGVMGFADMLFKLKIPYNSEEAIETAETVMSFIQEEAHLASKFLAGDRGVFPNFDKSVFKDQADRTYRNATCTTIAPTGTLSILADCSSGVEPLFALSFVRRVMDNDELLEVNPYFEEVAKERGFYSLELMDTIAREGSLSGIDEIPEDVKKVFVTAHDVTPEWHIKMQAAFQKYTDNAVSKTVNLPREATVENVREVYDLAYESGCKGVTIYRDGSKKNQVLSFGGVDSDTEGFVKAVRERPETLEGFVTKIKTGMGHLYITVTEFNGRPFEVFAIIGKSGKSIMAKTEAIGRLISLALRSGVKVEEVVRQIKGIGGEHAVFQNGGLVLSIPDAIGRVLEQRYLKDTGSFSGERYGSLLSGDVCPECGRAITFEEGCQTCHYCGFTKCG
jgi:ribonucleoside-diphosphate reductase alpha chain